MKTFGLTGNIGCGKSTIAGILAGFPNVKVIYCDTLAKEIIARKEHQATVNAILGINVYKDDVLETKLMAGIIFNDENKKKAIERFFHPLLLANIEAIKAPLPDNFICIVETAILFETKWEDKFIATIVATCPKEEQIRRLVTYRKMSLDDIANRMARQMPSSEKESRATFVIDTACGRHELYVKVENLFYDHLKDYKGV